MRVEKPENLTIGSIYKMVLEMKEKLDILESGTEVPQSDMERGLIKAISLKLESIKAELAEIKEDRKVVNSKLEAVHVKLAKVDADIENVKTDQSEMNADMKVINSKLEAIHVELAEIKEDRKVVNSKLEAIHVKLTEVNADIKALKVGQAEMKQCLAILMSEQSKFKDNIYKWGIGLAAGIIVSVSSIVSTVVLLAN